MPQKLQINASAFKDKQTKVATMILGNLPATEHENLDLLV